MMIPRTLQILLLAAGLILLAFSGFYAFELKKHEPAATDEWDFRDETNLELYTLPNEVYQEDGAGEPVALEELQPQDMRVGKDQPLKTIPLQAVPEQAGMVSEGGAYHLPMVFACAGGLFLLLGLFSLQYKKISLSADREA